MSIELIKESFRVEEIVGKNQIQALVEGEIYISPTKENIDKVLWLQGKVDILNTKLIQDKIIINGIVKFNLLYKGKEEVQGVHQLETSKEFREELEILGVDEDMLSKVQSKIEYIEWEIEEEKLILKALVNLSGEVEELKEVTVIKEIKNNDSLQTLKEEIQYKEVFNREISYALVKDALSLNEQEAQIDEVLGLNIYVKEIESMVVEDRIISSAEVVFNIIYGSNNEIYSKKGSIPFNHFIDMPGAYKELSTEVEFQVVEGSYEIVGNELGERKIIELEVKVKILGKAYELNSRELILDAYSTDEVIQVERDELNIKENIKRVDKQEKFQIDIPDIYAKDVLDVVGNVNLVETRILDDNIVIDGYMTLEILYIDRLSNELNSLRDDFPFRFELDEEVSYDIDFETFLKLDSINSYIRKDNLDIESNILIKLNLMKNRKIYAIKEIKETKENINKKSMSSITIYIVQREDSIWDIAKRYNTTMDEIVNSNHLPSKDISPGNKIIIEKKIENLSI